MNSFIFYTLPKSRTTQQLNGGRKIEKAWENVAAFLVNCTTAVPNSPKSILLKAFSASKGDSNPEIADRFIEQTNQLFRVEQAEPIAFLYPNNVPSIETKTEWKLQPMDLDKALNYLIKGQPWPKFNFGPIELNVYYEFKLIDPETKAELPNQVENSRLMIWLSRNCICSPDLFFPFEQTNQEFYEYLRKIGPYLPFKLDHKFLRLARLNKRKTNYVFTKLKTV